ncbi:ATP-binding protein [Streptomyces hypolithicus]
MSLSAKRRPRRIPSTGRASFSVPLVVLVATAAAGGAVAAVAPASARGWVQASVAGAWVCLAVTIIVSMGVFQRLRHASDRDAEQVRQLQQQSEQQSAEGAHLVHVSLPSVAKRLRDGTGVNETLAGVAPPVDPQHRQLLQTFAFAVAEAEKQAASAGAAGRQTAQELSRIDDDLVLLSTATLPAAVAELRGGASAERVLAGAELPADDRLRAITETALRELAVSERRAAAAQAASAKALSRVQAKSVSMLADLRDMQERHGEEVFGDLLKLDHSTSQLGLMTDRLALLMGGRASRAWNKPIVMESVLRGAVGRISAYKRVRLHCATNVAIAGFAAEGVMHLLAELMDNAANFSPPIDEVHVYVEEASAGIVVTIEDSGLKMAEAAMRRAAESVSGRVTDLSALQGTRLGLAVVGRLAVKYGISVSYRPSSRGGTGAVVLFPHQLIAQQAAPVQGPAAYLPGASAAAPAAASALPAESQGPQEPLGPQSPQEPLEPQSPQAPQDPRAAQPAGAGAGAQKSTPNGLPVRPPGRTMATAHTDRPQRPAAHPAPADSADSTATETAIETATGAETTPGRDAGTQFGAFHRGRRSGAGDSGQPPRSD